MRTYAVSIFGIVTIVTKKLETFLWKTISTQPTIEMAYSAAVFCTIIVHMVDGKKFRTYFATAHTLIAVGCKNLAAPLASQAFLVSLMSITIIVSITLLISRTYITKAPWFSRANQADGALLWWCGKRTTCAHTPLQGGW